MKLSLIHIVFILIFPLYLSGQHHFFRQYSLEEGLPQSEVYDIVEDRFGYLWLGTNGGGLCRFNGRGFEIFTKKDGLLGDLIMGLHSDNNYDLWIGSPKGITKYDGSDFIHYIKSDTALFQGRMQFLETIDGTIWTIAREVSGKRTIYKISEDSVINFSDKHPHIFRENKIFFSMRSGAKKIMIATSGGVYEVEDDKVSKSGLYEQYGLEDYMLLPLLQDKYRNIWTLAFSMQKENQELLKLGFDGSITKIDWPKSISLEMVFRVYEDRNGSVWIALATGEVGWIKNDEIKVFGKNSGLNTSLVTCFGEDREGNVWIGTSGGGLFKYGGDRFVSFSKESGIGGDIIRTIFQDSKGDIYFGYDNNSISVYDGNKIRIIEPSEGVKLTKARKVIELKNGNLLIATVSGLFEYNGKKIIPSSEKYGLEQSKPVNDLIQHADTIWMAIYGGGLLKYVPGDENKWYKSSNSGLKSNYISSLFIDSKRNIWISTTKGVYKYDRQTFIHYDDNKNLNSAWVLQAAEDKAGNIWFATFTGGLNRFDGENFTYYDSSEGIRSDNIYSVIADAEGNIWAGTQNGVDKVTLDQAGEIVSIQNFDKDDGFTGIENNGGSNYIDRQGRLWFGTIKGAMMYNPEAERTNYLEPPVYLTDILLNFEIPNWDSDSLKVKYDELSPWFYNPLNLRLPYNKNHIAFVFDALNFTAPEKVKYRWKLEPLEQEWSPENDFNMAFYPALEPGKYTFKVIACNNDGVWNEEGTSYSFEIRPAWYQYTWVRFLGIVIILGGLIWLIRLRIAKEQKLKFELEAVLASKKLEIQKQKAEITNQNEELKKQKTQLESQANSLQAANQDLERLTRIGQLVTSNLSNDRISELLYQSVSKVMSTDIFSVGLFNSVEKSIDFTHAYLNGERQPFVRYLIEDKERLAIYSFTHDREIFINDFYVDYKQYVSEIRPVPSGAESESVIYIPLRSTHEVIGVISTQSLKKNAYTNYHFNFLKNIANYASIAFENATAYQSLMQEQKKLQNKHENILGEKDVLGKQKKQLEELNLEKNQLFNLFIKGVQEPLNNAIGQMQTFKQQSNCTDEQKQFLYNLIRILNQQNELVNKVLEVRNIENEFYSYQPQEFDLHAIINEVITGLKEISIYKNVHVNVSGNNTLVNLDMNLLMRIIENLLSNAIRYSPENEQIQVITILGDDKVKIEVHDRGPGLTEEEKVKIFEKYSKIQNMNNDEVPTSGLGLYIVKKYVDVMNGSIHCESVSGFGASFIVEFPTK